MITFPTTPIRPMTPYERHVHSDHRAAGHTNRVSFNGIDEFEECAACQLSWKLPTSLRPADYPITIYRFPLEGGQR